MAGARTVPGGDVNVALHVRLADGAELFVKWRPDAPTGAFVEEARDLEWLRVDGGPRVPRVVAVGDTPGERFLALEWVPRGTPAPDHDARLGRGLAMLHRAGAPRPGREGANWIGPLPQPAGGDDVDWPAFYGAARVLPMVRRAREMGRLDDRDAGCAERLVDRLPELCGPPEPMSRLHGDLWSGNAYPGPDGLPVLVDPAAYGGGREVDLAMMHLFGGFGPGVFDAYSEVHPLPPGWRDRVELYQLYPLLVHVVMFGGGYVTDARRVLRRYGG